MHFGFFCASFRAVLGMKCASITSNFAGIPDDVTIRDRHSEAERASLRQDPIELFTYDSRLQLYQILSENVYFVASCVRSCPALSPSGPHNGGSLLMQHRDSIDMLNVRISLASDLEVLNYYVYYSTYKIQTFSKIRSRVSRGNGVMFSPILIR